MCGKTTLQEQFEAFHLAHPGIYLEFKRIAQELRAKRSHYGAKAIMEIVRYHRAINNEEPFKVNNNYTSRYARLLIFEDQRFADFFETRPLKKE